LSLFRVLKNIPLRYCFTVPISSSII
jgi:hypothetical protein